MWGIAVKKSKFFILLVVLLALSLITVTACGKKPPNDNSGDSSVVNGSNSSDGGASDNTGDNTGNNLGDAPTTLSQTTVYLVGDSTVCSFSDSYYYPRYGYGTQLKNYLKEEATVQNLALSGRSSKSFLAESNYATLKNNIKEGDYLIIGFGHNDQKSDDSSRFTDASKPYTDPTSFGYYLNEYYIKLAREKGATPILCTPIVRASSSNNYTGSEGHVTATGNYAQAIRDLAEQVNVTVIDLTELTAQRYAELGYSEACKYHAVIAGMYDTDGTTVIANMSTVDKTHLNIYGAKYVAYLLASNLKGVSTLGWYVLDQITAPTEADLVPISGYKVPSYTAPVLDNYNAPAHFATISEGWYGTAFGDTGGSPSSSGNGYLAQETTQGVFKVGNTAGKGKFASSSDGFAFAFRQVEADKNFILTVSGEILQTKASNQTGFGLMLRDDTYINLTATDTSIISNYVTAGFLVTNTGVNVNFARENATLNKGTEISSTAPAVGETFTATIERIGQTVNVTVVYGGQTYQKSYYDFDFLAKDTGYMYVGMFANRGTVIEFTNVSFTITGTSQGA